MKQIKANPHITQKELAAIVGQSERTVKTRTIDLQARGLLAREDGKRNRKWVVLMELD